MGAAGKHNETSRAMDDIKEAHHARQKYRNFIKKMENNMLQKRKDPFQKTIDDTSISWMVKSIWQ